jgi:hypothetical protein
MRPSRGMGDITKKKLKGIKDQKTEMPKVPRIKMSHRIQGVRKR